MARTALTGLWFAGAIFSLAILKYFPASRFAQGMAADTIGLFTVGFSFLVFLCLILSMREAMR